MVSALCGFLVQCISAVVGFPSRNTAGAPPNDLISAFIKTPESYCMNQGDTSALWVLSKQNSGCDRVQIQNSCGVVFGP